MLKYLTPINAIMVIVIVAVAIAVFIATKEVINHNFHTTIAI